MAPNFFLNVWIFRNFNVLSEIPGILLLVKVLNFID